MKTFREFLEEAYLYEMRKEDKVKGKKKHPLNITQTSGRVERAPEESGKKWEVKKSSRTTMHPDAQMGRYMQGMKNYTRPGSDWGGASGTYSRHAHGGGGSGAKAPGRKRGVGKIEQQKMDKEKRDSGERDFSAGPSPAKKVELRRAQKARSMGGGQR